jgi:hypothetical protein
VIKVARRRIRLRQDAAADGPIVHQLLCFVILTQSRNFPALLGKHYPTWRQARIELNELTLGSESWSTT